MINKITRTEKIEMLKRYFGWDDKFISKLTPRLLASAYGIMLLEEENNKQLDIKPIKE